MNRSEPADARETGATGATGAAGGQAAPAALDAPIFLVGCPRSGTTLLQEMLDAHPQVAIAPETFFVRRFWVKKHKFGPLLDDAKFEQLLDAITSMPEFAEAGLDKERYRVAARGRSRRWDQLFRLLLEQFAESRGVKRVGEKTPNHLLYMDKLQEWFPTAKFVHVLRDPRAVALSWRGVPWSNGSLAADAEVWRKYARAALDHGLLNPNALHTVRYEELVANPRAVLGRLCTFLRIDFDEAMLRYHERPASSVNVEREPWKARSRGPVDAAAADRWKRELTSAEVRTIEAIVRGPMIAHGYTPVNGVGALLPAKLREGVKRVLREAAKSLGLSKRSKAADSAAS